MIFLSLVMLLFSFIRGIELLQHSFYRIIIEIFEKARELESKIKQPEPLKLSNPGCA